MPVEEIVMAQQNVEVFYFVLDVFRMSYRCFASIRNYIELLLSYNVINIIINVNYKGILGMIKLLQIGK